MATFTSTQVDTVLGKLTNGRKLVHTIITITSAGVDATTITISPLKRIIAWTIGLALPATDTFVCADQGTLLNQITIDPSGDSTNDVIHILSVGV